MRHSTPLLVLLVCLCAAMFCAGCAVKKPETKLPEVIRSDVAVTREQMRLRMRSLVEPMCSRIEQAADEIIAGTKDPEVQLAAMDWKIQAVPAMREALFQPEPFSGAYDALVLCYQMADYFETGAGRQALGPASQQAAAACRVMEEELSRILAAAMHSGDLSKVRDSTKKWATGHPIRYSISDRATALSRAFEREAAEQFSTGQAIAEVTTSMDDMSRKMETYSAQLFRQARWEAERLKLETVRELRAEEVVPLGERIAKSTEQIAATLDRLVPALDRTLSVANDMPRLIADERGTAVKAVQDEVTRATEFIRDERVAALDQ